MPVSTRSKIRTGSTRYLPTQGIFGRVHNPGHPYHRGKGATREKEKTPACTSSFSLLSSPRW
eukprot:scaffold9143_cov153-Skeletonema_dohrnii-CCMP3373.AAC.1